jgi:hypothetical protein
MTYQRSQKLININRVIKISTIDNGYLLEFHEAKGQPHTEPDQQHHLKAYKTFEELEADLAKMTSAIALSGGNIHLN